MKRVVITGMGGISPIGNDWPTIRARLKSRENAVVEMPEWGKYEGLHTRLGAPAAPFTLDDKVYTRRTTRSMGRVALMGTRATEMALVDAGLLGDPILKSGKVGLSFGSCSGSPKAIADFARMMVEHTTEGINATTYIKMMPHTAPVNIGVFFGLTGRIITTSSACTSGSQGIGYAYEAIKYGKQTAMVAGGAEELDATQVAVFDTLFATSTKNDRPKTTPSPFDAERDGLVIGEGAGALILEELDFARARGARIYAEVLGFGTNSDGTHVTNPSWETMAGAMQSALADAQSAPADIAYINAHGTATDQGDAAETRATRSVFGERALISSLKSYMGHTLGACGALEAWMTIEMMREGWFSPTTNLTTLDPKCAPLDYIVGEGRSLEADVVMSNNFAFGGINTSLIFRRWREA
jgi:3-oxoacyl-[acyl-carrier-protein] synthase II